MFENFGKHPEKSGKLEKTRESSGKLGKIRENSENSRN